MPGMGSTADVSPFGVVVGSQPMQGPNPHANYAFSPDDAGQLLTFSCARPLCSSAVVQVHLGLATLLSVEMHV